VQGRRDSIIDGLIARGQSAEWPMLDHGAMNLREWMPADGHPVMGIQQWVSGDEHLAIGIQ
jgi:hypothetical protein